MSCPPSAIVRSMSIWAKAGSPSIQTRSLERPASSGHSHSRMKSINTSLDRKTDSIDSRLDSFPDQRGAHGRVAQRFDFALALPGVHGVQIGVETGVAAELGRALGKLLDDFDQGFDSDQIREGPATGALAVKTAAIHKTR